MNALTHAARALSLALLLATTAFTGGCAVGTDSTEEPAVNDINDVTKEGGEGVGEAQDPITGGVNIKCGYCMIWSTSEQRCVRSELSICAIPGNG